MADILNLAESTIKQAKALGIDYADIRTSLLNSTSFTLHNNKFQSSIAGESFGVGVRVIHKGKLGFYSTNDASKASKALELALKLAKTNPSKKLTKLAPAEVIKKEYSTVAKKPIKNISIDEKVKLARELTRAAQLEKVRSVDIDYSDAYGKSILYTTEGTELVKNSSRTVIKAYVTAKAGDRIETTSERYGGFGFEKYDNIISSFKEKAKLAIDLLKARKPKAGTFDSVMDNEAAGVFAHEAVGHACEADIVLSGASVLKGKIGKKIGSDAVNITDSPTIEDEWGSYHYDSEGVPAQYTKLIEKGVLKGYMHNRATAGDMNTTSTGNGRAQGYNFIPIVRMSNTFFEGGEFTNEELIKDIKNGYLLIGFRGGTVNPLSGDFTFACESAREINNGELGKLLKGCTFGGSILETLNNIYGCGPFNKKMGIGWCGKSGQMVPAGDGACHVGVRKLHIGGEE